MTARSASGTAATPGMASATDSGASAHAAGGGEGAGVTGGVESSPADRGLVAGAAADLEQRVVQARGELPGEQEEGLGPQLGQRDLRRPGQAMSSGDQDNDALAADPVVDELAGALHELATEATRLRVRAPGALALQEATAALQDLACQAVSADGARLEARRTEFSALMEGLSPSIRSAPNGPYLLANVHTMTDWLGVSLQPMPQAALCRCGARSADEVGLAADAEFRAAFTAYLEWGSRIALENSQPGVHPPPHMPVPRWWWVCDAYPWSRPHATAEVPAPEPPPKLPEATEALSFATHIKPLFRQRDRDSMRFAFDLWSQADLAAHGEAILARLRAGTMPCDGAWPAEQIDVFERWLATGMAP